MKVFFYFQLKTYLIKTMNQKKQTFKVFIDNKYQYLTEEEFLKYEKEFLKQFEFKKIINYAKQEIKRRNTRRLIN